jgi:hypothetical protein
MDMTSSTHTTAPSTTSTSPVSSASTWRTGRVRSLLAGSLAGSFLANALPHLFFALTLQTHATPFGADSSITVNLLWGIANLILGTALTVFPSNRRHILLFTTAALIGAASTAISLAILWA